MEALKQLIQEYDQYLLEAIDGMRDAEEEQRTEDKNYYEGKRDAYNQTLGTLKQLFGYLQ